MDGSRRRKLKAILPWDSLAFSRTTVETFLYRTMSETAPLLWFRTFVSIERSYVFFLPLSHVRNVFETETEVRRGVMTKWHNSLATAEFY